MHAALAACLRIQGALEYTAENRRADGTPIKIIAGVLQQQVGYLLVETGYLNAALGEQATTDVRECGKVITQVWIALVLRGIQGVEQVNQGPTHISGPRLELHQVVMELVARIEQSCVFGIQAKHQTDAEDIQTTLGMRVFRVAVLLQERFIYLSDDGSSRHRNFDLLFLRLFPIIHEELQAVVLFL